VVSLPLPEQSTLRRTNRTEQEEVDENNASRARPHLTGDDADASEPRHTPTGGGWRKLPDSGEQFIAVVRIRTERPVKQEPEVTASRGESAPSEASLEPF